MPTSLHFKQIELKSNQDNQPKCLSAKIRNQLEKSIQIFKCTVKIVLDSSFKKEFVSIPNENSKLLLFPILLKLLTTVKAIL